MKIKIIVALTLLLNMSYTSYAQGISNIWLSGYASWGGLPYGGNVMDFYNGTPTVQYKYIPMNFSRGVATISDSLGNIKLYTNGIWIAGANDDTIVDGGGISPPVIQDSLGLWVSQTTLFLPKPSDSNIYYLFHSSIDDPPYDTTCYYLRCSTVDMNMNGGLGGVSLKNQIIINDTIVSGNITACKHGNGRDWWLIVLEKNTNGIYEILVTPYGLSNPIKLNYGFARKMGVNQSSFSPDGTKFAYINGIDSLGIYRYKLIIQDFNRCTGAFSNNIVVDLFDNPPVPRGVAFSSDSKKLYISATTKVFQYDVTQTVIKNSEIQVAEWDSFYSPSPPFAALYFFMGLALDGKIYISTGNGTMVMHIIDQPDSPGTACNFIQHGLQLPAFSVSAPPNHPNYFLGANGLCNNLGLDGLESWKVKKVTVFGNPTRDKFTLWFPPDKDVGWLEVYDVNGNVILSERVSQWSQYKTVDVSSLASGVYYCKMRWPVGEGSVKVMKIPKNE